MAPNTTCTVRRRRGHHIDSVLSDKPPDRRLGFAAWLAQRDCRRCWVDQTTQPSPEVPGALVGPASAGAGHQLHVGLT
jgi:hypothetical protein